MISDMTEIPLRDGVLTQKQFEDEIQPLGLAAMERIAG